MLSEEQKLQQQEIQARIFQKTSEVKQIVRVFNENKRMRNRARQLRTESPAGFIPLRDAAFPYDDVYEPYKILNEVCESVRRSQGHLILDRVLNYLRLLAARSLFPRGRIQDQIIVLLTAQGEVGSIQLVPAYLSKFKQPVAQLKELSDFLFVMRTFPLNDDAMEVYFPNTTNGISEKREIEDVAQVVESITQIDLIASPGKVFICDNLPLSTQLIFENKAQLFQKENDFDLWIILSRFCNENRAIVRLELLPEWLDQYVRYENPKPLPSAFTNLVNTQHPLGKLRILLGMYPEKLDVNHYLVSIPDKDQILALRTQLPSWLQTRVDQMLCIAEEFHLNDFVENGVFIGCPPTPDGLRLLCSHYE